MLAMSKRKLISFNAALITLHEDVGHVIAAGEIDLPQKSCCGTHTLNR
jgi:hypothetical protein